MKDEHFLKQERSPKKENSKRKNSDKIVQEQLLETFTEQYFEKLFYFCLKKTGGSNEAQELVSDITLNIIAALRKGTIPANFPAWVWQIARNRYSVWADHRRSRRESDSGADITELELMDERVSIESEWIHKEDLKLLRRELSFISSDYREIVLAYYIDDRSVRDIADSLRLPEGTVKSKLSRARERLKEGMHMAREFGTMSYKPENVYFVNCCYSFGTKGEPWSYLNRMLCKNILLAAYRTPSTAEELAVELGVALPYMEDELRQLKDATLLNQSGKKYETNFFIAGTQLQKKIYAHLKGITPELTDAVIAALEYKVKCLEENASRWHEDYQPYEDMKWALLMQEVDDVSDEVKKQVMENCRGKLPAGKSKENSSKLGKHGFTMRPNKGEWDVFGYEEYHGEHPAFVGQHGGVGDTGEFYELRKMGIDLCNYRFNYHGISSDIAEWLDFEEVKALAELAGHGNSGISDNVLHKLEEKGFAVKGENGYHPTFRVSFLDGMNWLTREQSAEYDRLKNKAEDICMRHYLFCYDAICQEVPDFLKADFHQIAFAGETLVRNNFRGAVLEEALRKGWLIDEKNGGRRMLGVYMNISSSYAKMTE